MKKMFITLLVLAAFCITGVAQAVNLDDFNGPNLNKMWTYRDPAKKGTVKFEKGMLVLDLLAGADMYIRGTDGGVCFLMDPPALDNYSVEMLVNVAVNGTQPPATQVGPIFFNEDEWAYSIWGPYAATDIRLEDCVGGSYRWRADIGIGIDLAKVAIDQDVYVKVTKTGTKLEFFAKNDENDNWVSGGVDAKLGPNYIQGKYKVGFCAKSWGGSVNSTFNIDYFTIPEIAKAVDRLGKLTTTWSSLKK
jgi:hypothetical protein